MAVSSPSDSWIGASVLRKEDARHLRGRGQGSENEPGPQHA